MENGNGWGVWNTSPTLRRSSSRSMVRVSRPRRQISPFISASGSSHKRPFSARRSVVFPLPDGPMTARIRPGRIPMFTSFNTGCSP